MKLRNLKIDFGRQELPASDLNQPIILKTKSQEKTKRMWKLLEELDLADLRQVWAVKRDFQKLGLEELLPWVTEWGVTKLYFWSNREQKILKHISHIRLREIKEIHIGWNKIESIESLNQIDMPQLNDLVLRDNNIISVRELRKCLFPNLKQICLRGNPLTDVLTDLWWSPQLKNLNVNQTQVTSQRFVFKLESSNLTIIRLHSQNTVQSPSLNGETFKKKFRRLDAINL